MANTDITSLLIEKLKADFPDRVHAGPEAETQVLSAPSHWKRIGAFPIGSPDFLRASRERLSQGESVAVFSDPGRAVMVFSQPAAPRAPSTPGGGTRRSEVRPEVEPPAPKRPAAPAATPDKLPPRHAEPPAPPANNPFGAISPKLAGVLAQAEESVQRAEAAAKERRTTGHGPTEPAAEGTGEAKPQPPSKLPPRDLAPPPNTRRQIIGFMLLVTLFVFKVVTHEPEKQGKRMVEGMNMPVFPDPYKAEKLDPLPSGKPPVVMRGGLLESNGKLQKKQLGRLVEAVIPQMRHCYHKELLADPTGVGEGEARFSVSWDAEGKLVEAVAESAPGNGKIGECGVAALGLLTLPPEVSSEPVTGRTVVRFRATP